MLLAAEVEDDDGDDAHENESHGCTQVHRAVATLEVLDVDGDGTILIDVQHEVGQEVVVPNPHDLQNTHGNEGGLQHGNHHIEVGADRAAAVDGGSFLNGEGDGLDKAREHEYRQTCAEAEVDNGNRPRSVQIQLIIVNIYEIATTKDCTTLK